MQDKHEEIFQMDEDLPPPPKNNSTQNNFTSFSSMKQQTQNNGNLTHFKFYFSEEKEKKFKIKPVLTTTSKSEPPKSASSLPEKKLQQPKQILRNSFTDCDDLQFSFDETIIEEKSSSKNDTAQVGFLQNKKSNSKQDFFNHSPKSSSLETNETDVVIATSVLTAI